jgi:hypothetical protein
MCWSIASSVPSDTERENTTVVGAAATRVDHSPVTVRPLATRRMMNNCAIPWFNKTLTSETETIRVVSTYLNLSNRQET